VERSARRVAAERGDGAESVAVATFPLRRAFRPDLWDEAVGELDVVARGLAERNSRSAQLSIGRNSAVAGRRARIYEIRYRRSNTRVLDRVAFLFAGRREFQLTCRIDADQPDEGESACRELFVSFRA
jgi:hypothetical protein